MGSLFGQPKVSTPKVPPPPAIPEARDPEDVLRKRRRGGFHETILTGALVPQTGKKRVLG